MSERHIILDARTECLDEAIEFINSSLAGTSCPEEIAQNIDLAVEEIFINITNYAYNDKTGKIEIIFEPRNSVKTLVITITDNGKPFNPLNNQDPDITIPLDEREPGGLGIFLVKRMMDNVEYKYENGYNNLTMSKSW